MGKPMHWLMSIMAWRSKQPAVVCWLQMLALFAAAIAARLLLGRLYGGNPSLTFYPVLLLVSVLFGWKEALAFLALSVMAGLFLFLPPDMYLLPLGWLFVGSLTIVTINALKTLAQELATANERQVVLFRELQHRVANTLQSVVGTLDAASAKIDTAPGEARNILEKAAERISASADVHRRLHDPALFDQGLAAILRNAVETVIDGRSTDIGFDIMPLKLSFDQMSIITMAVIEIANNAQKHVFERKLGRHFLVSLRALTGDRAVLSVTDDGPGWSPSSAGGTERTLGLTLLQGLADQLGGRLSMKSTAGTEVSIAFSFHSRGMTEQGNTLRQP